MEAKSFLLLPYGFQDLELGFVGLVASAFTLYSGPIGLHLFSWGWGLYVDNMIIKATLAESIFEGRTLTPVLMFFPRPCSGLGLAVSLSGLEGGSSVVHLDLSRCFFSIFEPPAAP